MDSPVSLVKRSSGADPRVMQSLMYHLGLTGLLGAGAGAGARGLQGLLNLGRRSFAPRPTTALSFTLPTRKEEDEEKVAESNLNPFTWQTPKTWKEHWGMIPGMIAAGGGGAYGGHKLMDWLMNKRKEQELEDELTQARTEYEQALSGQFAKTSEINRDLDCLFDLYKQREKSADVNTVLGLMLALAGGTGLLSGSVAYNMAKKRQKGPVTRAALQQHRRAVGLTRPSPIFAEPTPLRLNQPARGAPDEEELQGEPLDKAVA